MPDALPCGICARTTNRADRLCFACALRQAWNSELILGWIAALAGLAVVAGMLCHGPLGHTLRKMVHP